MNHEKLKMVSDTPTLLLCRMGFQLGCYAESGPKLTMYSEGFFGYSSNVNLSVSATKMQGS